MKSGWCAAGPPGSRPKHRWCRAIGCGCDCHQSGEASIAQTGHFRTGWDMITGTNKDGPERGVGTSGRGLADWIGVD